MIWSPHQVLILPPRTLTVSSFAPSLGPVSTNATIIGTNFSRVGSDDKVDFGGVRATLDSAGATPLSVTVPKRAKYAPISVTVVGSSALSALSFVVTFQGHPSITSILFAGKADFTTKTNPYGVAPGDIDGDGKLDLVFANYGENSISLFRRTSTGGGITASSFTSNSEPKTPRSPRSVAIGDIDGEGRLDIINVSTSESLFVFRNTSQAEISHLPPRLDFATGSCQWEMVFILSSVTTLSVERLMI